MLNDWKRFRLHLLEDILGLLHLSSSCLDIVRYFETKSQDIILSQDLMKSQDVEHYQEISQDVEHYQEMLSILMKHLTKLKVITPWLWDLLLHKMLDVLGLT